MQASSQHIKIRLKVIPQPALNTRTVSVSTFKGQGDIDLLCGICGEILVEGISKGMTIGNIVIRCLKCGAFNEQ